MEEAIAQLSTLEALADVWRRTLDNKAQDPAGKKLRLYTLLCTPEDEEEPLLDLAEDLFTDSRALPTSDVMELFDRAVYLYSSQGDFARAWEKLEQARQFAAQHPSPELRARFHYLCAAFYDARLAGRYDTDSDENDLQALTDSLDKAIRCLGAPCDENGKALLTEYLLSKAAVVVRSRPEARAEIRRALLRAGRLLPYCRTQKPSLERDFYLLCGWYFTLSRPDPTLAQKAMDKAKNIHQGLGLSDLETIDQLLIPCGNMLLELGMPDEAERQIRAAAAICDKRQDEAPYYRKKQELSSCLTDIQKVRAALRNPE